jgi:Flp pilus assembly protein TadD
VWAALAVAWLAAGLAPDPRAWGVHALAFLPRAVWVVAAIATALLAHPGNAARVGRAVVRLVSRVLASWPALGATAAGAAVLFYVLRLRFQFLGDGIVWLEKIHQRDAFHHFEPLSTFLVRTAALVGPGWKGAAQWPSVACGVVWLVATGVACRRAFAADAVARGTAWSLLVANPLLLLFFGYVESYPLVVALEAVLVAAWSGGASPRVAVASVLGCGIAVALHVQAVAWLPALAVVAAQAGGARRGRAALLAGLAVGVALAVGGLVTLAVGASPTALARALGSDKGIGGLGWSQVVAWRRGVDFANEVALLLGGALVVVAAARGAGTAWLRERTWAPIAVLAAGTAVVWGVPAGIGGARDWDLYTAIVLPVVLLAVEAWRRARARWPVASADAMVGRVVGLGLVCTTAWVAGQVMDARAARRMVNLQSAHGTFSNFARGYANEALGIYYRTRDPAEARAAYARAVEVNPKNPRYWNNLAIYDLMRHDVTAARHGLRQAMDLGMREWMVCYNLALVELQTGDLAAAATLADEMVQRFPDRWQAWLCHGQVRFAQGRNADAAVDLERARALAPAQPEITYALGLALREVGRHAAARAAFEATLRLAPDHADARRELERTPANP